jgi:REP element-mobilizing transposase RayT
VLAVAAERYDIRLHAVCVLSNHYHLVVTDPFARLPAFLRDLNSLVARALNASIPRWEDFWSASGHSAVTLGSSADVLEKAAYVLANPVAARLVRRACQWPGVWSAPATIGTTTLVVKRPSQFFDPDGPLPDSATLALSAPPGFHSAEAFRKELEVALAAREAEATRSSTRFMGLLKVLGQRQLDRPRDREARRGLSPRVASRDKWRRMELLGRLQQFARDYRRALEAWRSGYEPVFPAGTYLMRVVHGAICEGAG